MMVSHRVTCGDDVGPFLQCIQSLHKWNKWYFQHTLSGCWVLPGLCLVTVSVQFQPTVSYTETVEDCISAFC